jgi:hypothetical protein
VLELFVPRRLREEGLRLLRELEAAGAPARLYVVPDDFAYRLQLAVQYDPGAARPYLERGILAVPAAAWGGRAVAVGRLPPAAELLALTGSSPPPPRAATQQLPVPPVEVFELEVEPSPPLGALGGGPPEPRVLGLTEEGRRFLEEVLRRSGELLSAPPPPPPAETATAESQQLLGEGGVEEGVVVVEDAVKLAAAREAAAGEATAPPRGKRRRKKRGV